MTPHELDALRDAFHASPIPAVRWSDAVTATEAAALRFRACDAGFRRFELLHRGRYEVNDTFRGDDLIAPLCARAEAIAGEALTVRGARVVRGTHGSYALVRDDVADTRAQFELTLDFSEAAVPGGEVSYRHRGQTFFVLPSAPRSAALVARPATVRRNDRYLSHHAGDGAIYRLRLALATSATRG